MKKTGKIINFAAIGLIATVVITVNVLALGTFSELIQDRVFGYEINPTIAAQDRKKGEALATKIVEEGVVMVKNDNSLPLDKTKDKKVNVFGWGSTQWIGGGSGSGRVVQSGNNLTVKTGFLEALKNAGIEYNENLTNMYKSYYGTRPKFNEGTLNSYEYEYYKLIEPRIDSDYGDELLDGAKEFSDTAIVVLGRPAGESSDAPKVQYKEKLATDSTRSYLEISTEEENLLKYCGENFGNVIVLINSMNTMELGFLDTIPNIKSCLVVGGTGVNAANGIINVLYGDKSPSGRLTDTYAYNHETAASYANSGMEGENFYTNGSGLYPYDGKTNNGNVGNSNQKYPGLAYVDYSENIYVGYKWYETADVEGYWDDVTNDYGTGYEGVVQFPFGYGLSYTDFEWEISSVSPANLSELEKDSEIEVKVTVENVGDVPGQDVVELYYTAPYYDMQIEKSAINLVAFEKTEVLEPGKQQELTLTFNAEDMASYDCYDSNNNGFSGYELDQGKYQIKVMENAHNVKKSKNNEDLILEYEVKGEAIKFETDSVTGGEVNNKFTGEEALDGIGIDGEDIGANINYLSRSDFEGGFPQLEAARTIDEKTKRYNLYTSQMANDWINPDDEDIVTGASGNLKLYEDNKITELGLELGSDYDNDKWDTLLNQMRISDMTDLTLHGYCQTKAVSSIGKIKLTDADGPAQIGSFNFTEVGTGYPNATVLGQTWNKKLAYDMGIALGTEARNLGYNGWYGPGLNMHRSPYGGRNYEYYSEDALLNGVMSANQVKGAKNCGVYAYLKHIAVYDQESYRDGLYTWLTEQSFREIYLKPFKQAIQEGGATGIMTSYNRIGGVWTGGSYGLLTGVLRDEWGFKGAVITDYSDHHEFMNMDHALRAGGDLWMDGWQNNGTYKLETSSNSFKQALRRATKNILYSNLNALYTESIYNPSDDTKPVIIGEKGKPIDYWKTIIYVIDVVAFLGLATWGYFIIKPLKKKELKIEENK